MDNITFKIVGTKLQIEVDLAQAPLDLSESGKTHRVASTEGNKPAAESGIGKLVTLGVNAYVKTRDVTAFKDQLAKIRGVKAA